MTTDLGQNGTPQDWTWEQKTDRLFFTHDVESGMSNHQIARIPAGMFGEDLHVDKIFVALETAPGAGKTVTVTATDGITTMTVDVTEAETEDFSTANNYDWDVSEKDLLIECSSTGGTAVGAMSVVVVFHKITI